MKKLSDMQTLINNWCELKKLERESAKERRSIESTIVEYLDINTDIAGTTKKETQTHKATIACRLDHKVNADLLHEIANEHQVSSGVLSQLFRWEPKLNIKAWDATHDDIKAIISPAITVKPSKPSFKIDLLDLD